jgi:hypothetical protein
MFRTTTFPDLPGVAEAPMTTILSGSKNAEKFSFIIHSPIPSQKKRKNLVDHLTGGIKGEHK